MITVKDAIYNGAGLFEDELLKKAKRCRELGITPEMAIAIQLFEEFRHKIGKHEDVVFKAAAFDYAYGLKGLEDKADDFGRR